MFWIAFVISCPDSLHAFPFLSSFLPIIQSTLPFSSIVSSLILCFLSSWLQIQDSKSKSIKRNGSAFIALSEKKEEMFPLLPLEWFTWEADRSFAQIHLTLLLADEGRGVRKISGCTPLNVRIAEALNSFKRMSIKLANRQINAFS